MRPLLSISLWWSAGLSLFAGMIDHAVVFLDSDTPVRELYDSARLCLRRGLAAFHAYPQAELIALDGAQLFVRIEIMRDGDDVIANLPPILARHTRVRVGEDLDAAIERCAIAALVALEAKGDADEADARRARRIPVDEEPNPTAPRGMN